MKISDYGTESGAGEHRAGLPGANLDIQEARRREVLRLVDERRYRAALAATDCVIAHLEQLNLEGRGKERLGQDAASRLERVLAPVPRLLRPKIRARTVQRVLDAVLETQEPLLEWRRQGEGAQLGAPARGAAIMAS